MKRPAAAMNTCGASQPAAKAPNGRDLTDNASCASVKRHAAAMNAGGASQPAPRPPIARADGTPTIVPQPVASSAFQPAELSEGAAQVLEAIRRWTSEKGEPPQRRMNPQSEEQREENSLRKKAEHRKTELIAHGHWAEVTGISFQAARGKEKVQTLLRDVEAFVLKVGAFPRESATPDEEDLAKLLRHARTT